jgi:superfamily I DNA and/or RNA helicase
MLDPELLLVAGTSWLFAYEEMEGHVDTLFLDEAGQISLADALVCGTAARNLILLGDPNQLPQVSKGAQPEEAKVSVLQYLLGESVTVPEGRGIFLPETWRLRPELCEFTSRAYYDGRLSAAQVCGRRDLSAGNGLAVLTVDHRGCGQSSR